MTTAKLPNASRQATDRTDKAVVRLIESPELRGED